MSQTADDRTATDLAAARIRELEGEVDALREELAAVRRELEVRGSLLSALGATGAGADPDVDQVARDLATLRRVRTVARKVPFAGPLLRLRRRR